MGLIFDLFQGSHLDFYRFAVVFPDILDHLVLMELFGLGANVLYVRRFSLVIVHCVVYGVNNNNLIKPGKSFNTSLSYILFKIRK